MSFLAWGLVFILSFATLRTKLRAWLYRLTVRTEASQAFNPGSIPGRVTKKYLTDVRYFCDSTASQQVSKLLDDFRF